MGLFDSFRISGSALTAQRLRMDVISSNIANAETTETAEGGPYKARKVVFTPLAMGAKGAPGSDLSTEGVAVTRIDADSTNPRLVYEPDHPNARPDGFVAYPNVDVVTEMVDMLSATRAYEANVTAVNASKSMAQQIGRAHV